MHRKALDHFTKLATDFPEQPGFQTWVWRTAGGFAETFIRPQERVQLADEAEELLKVLGTSQRCRFGAVSMLNRCAWLARNDLQIGQEERVASEKAYSERAVELLRPVVTAPTDRGSLLEARNYAKEASEKLNSGACWTILGIVSYRLGEWKRAVRELTESARIRGGRGGDSNAFFFLAMSYWQLGDKEEARKWYDKAVEWMDQNKPQNEDLLRFRAEAAELLGVKEPAPPNK
jgi:tetratricopeptide (TPR) repeat protein